jgi:uncharacterized membrane protein
MSMTKADRWVPAGLILVAVAPIIGGAVRLQQIGSGVVTLENARFLEAPVPVVLHLLSAIVYCIVGAFQFAPGLRRSRPRWHRRAGQILIPLGLAAALSGLWMTLTFPWPEHDGVALYAIRLVVGSAMALFLGLGYAAARKRDFASHGAWMTRAYALGLGAGTQAFTHIPWFLFPSIQGELARTVCMGAGWALNAAAAEWALSRSAAPGPLRGLAA